MTTGKRNKLTGQIGEHLVSAKLGTMGYYAAPYSGNVPGFDIIAVNSETLRTYPVQVKTSNGGALVHSVIHKWVEHHVDENNYQHLGKLLKLPNPDIIWIMVQIKDSEINSARYFVCTEAEIQNRMVERYKRFMEKHNYKRPGGGASPQAILSVKDMLYLEDNWEVLTGD
jgi:hypothetical protein